MVNVLAARRNKIRDILMTSKAVSTTKFVERVWSGIAGHEKSYYVPNPDSQVTINYNILANDLVKNGYGNVQEFSKEVVDMLMLFCDDDDQISIKKCELEVNMKSILGEFV